MAREAELFDMAGGSPLEGYLMLKRTGGNIPPRWIENSRTSRKNHEPDVVEALQEGGWGDIATLRDWELRYRKECFYYGIRVLLELERNGESPL